MGYGKHSAPHGTRRGAGRHSIPKRHKIGGRGIATGVLALALSAACVPVGISVARPAAETAGTQQAQANASVLPETPESQEMTPQEKAAIDRILGKHELTTGEKAVKIARQFLGTPYVWGGEAPGGFDCSGLTRYVYGKLGIDLVHYAQTQYGQGARVSSGKLKEGDLVFFGSAGSIEHVGIYAGKGAYIHAPQTGDVVKVSQLSDRSDYVGACRPR